MAKRTQAQVFWFSRKREVEQGAFTRDVRIFFRNRYGEREIMPVSEIPLKGSHNVENVLAGISIGMLMGSKPEQTRKAIREFKAVEHRLEYVASIRGVDYYNDSKATNVDATIKALESFPANIHIILGGKDKGSDYTMLAPLVRERVKQVVLLGAASDKIAAQLEGVRPLTRAASMQDAVEQAQAAAHSGDTVLLAPACASFDMFDNYEHRGRVFKQEVMNLQRRVTSDR